MASRAERRDLMMKAIEGQDFCLRVAAGPDVDKVLSICAGAATRAYLGTSPASDFCLSDLRVFAQHAAFYVTGRQLVLEDLGSTHGTFVNGVQVRNVFLKGGEAIRVGDTTVMVNVQVEGEPLTKLALPSRFGRVIGDSAAMQRLYPFLAKLAASNVPVVIEGETGTGKELVAEAIHEAGSRADSPFVVSDCTTVPPNLVESALFGHERGSFTGAISTRQGVFEQAHKGTLFLDEIGDLDIALQAKLLRALERREVQRVGASNWIKVDVRIVAATRRDLEEMIRAKTFRDDLFYRLAVARAQLPPLRTREGDVDVLARYFWQQLGGSIADFPPSAMKAFLAYDWPGNVRELFNAVSHTMALGELSTLPSRHGASLPSLSHVAQAAAPSGPSPKNIIESVLEQGLGFPAARDQVLREFERRFLETILARHGGNISKASKASGIKRRFFYILRARQET